MLVAVLLLSACQKGLDNEETVLQARCAASTPTWDNYPEDIKAQIGAGPVAAWRGEVTQVVWGLDDAESAATTAPVIQVFVTMEAPWSKLDAALPLLLREPQGSTLTPVASRLDGDVRMYRYALPAELADVMPPWVTLRTPRGIHRYPLGAGGKWTP